MTTTHQHTTAGWARAFTAVFEAAANQPHTLTHGHSLLNSAGALNVNQGFATTKFTLPDRTVLRPRLQVTELTPAQWDRAYTAIAHDPDLVPAVSRANITDLLADPRRTAGIPLVPTADDISFTCPCRTGPGVCPHTAAVGHLLAQRIRTAPAALLTLRGRAHHHLKKFLRSTPQPGPAPQPAGLRTTPPSSVPPRPSPAPFIPVQPLFPGGTLPPIPAIASNVAQAGFNAATEPPSPAPTLTTLNTLVTDAAHRAAAYLNGEQPALCPDPESDLARLVATEHGQPHLEHAAAHLNLPLLGMRQLVAAFDYGGPAGALTYLHPQPADPEHLAQAEAAIQPFRPAPLAPLEREHNQITDTAARVQIRRGPDNRWYPYITHFGSWHPTPGPGPDPATAYKAARAAQRQRLGHK
ncbi:hypothetical protein [Streptomyces sp. BRA346]|uniref:hypothetical protein n=1 Tax=Streptomyces sp. BRA346 TaxID=2878199 RepID=UPI004063A9FF